MWILLEFIDQGLGSNDIYYRESYVLHIFHLFIRFQRNRDRNGYIRRPTAVKIGRGVIYGVLFTSVLFSVNLAI